jgi:hypothetical protein
MENRISAPKLARNLRDILGRIRSKGESFTAWAAVLIGSLAALSCSAAEPPPLAASASLAITGVTLIDGTGAPPRAGTTILIRDARILAVVSDGEARVPAHATVIDGAGKYVIPGLVDLHAHRPSDLAQYLFYGVTSVLQLGVRGPARTRSATCGRAAPLARFRPRPSTGRAAT